jgi:hypothetical protein
MQTRSAPPRHGRAGSTEGQVGMPAGRVHVHVHVQGQRQWQRKRPVNGFYRSDGTARLNTLVIKTCEF